MYLSIARKIAQEIKEALVARLAKSGYIGETLKDPKDLKSSHDIDSVATAVAHDLLRSYNASVFIESMEGEIIENSAFSVYIDPVDGSLNWERGVGDPCFVMAVADFPKIVSLDELSFAYVMGLRSGDEYWTEDGKAFYRCALVGKEKVVVCSSKTTLAQSTAYLRAGYGFAACQLKHTLPLFYKVRDIRAFDNAGMEFCEVARGAADLMVEARDASDAFNLLTWPILRAAGGVLTDLKGNNLASQPIQIGKSYNYIAAANAQLVQEAICLME